MSPIVDLDRMCTDLCTSFYRFATTTTFGEIT